MPRSPRMKLQGSDVYYHIMTQVAGQEFLIKSREKDELLKIIDRFTSIYFIKLTGFCIMDNHYHLVVKSETSSDYSEDEIESRLILKTQKKKFTDEERARHIEQLGNISEYMKNINQTFSCWYNKPNKRKGHFWAERFKSTIIEKQAALAKCSVYADLNPIRAGIVKRPENYRWSSIYARHYKTSMNRHLSFCGILDTEKFDKSDSMLLYRRMLYASGAVSVGMKGTIPLSVIEKEKSLGFRITAGDRLFGRVRHFSDGCVIGSREFVMQAYGRFAGISIHKKERKAHSTPFDTDIFSLTRLQRQNP